MDAADLFQRLREALIACADLTTPPQARALFADPRLLSWHDHVPDANSPAARADTILSFLHGRENEEGEPALLVFLAAIRDRVHPADVWHGRLGALAEEVAVAIAEDSLPPPPTPSAATRADGSYQAIIDEADWAEIERSYLKIARQEWSTLYTESGTAIPLTGVYVMLQAMASRREEEGAEGSDVAPLQSGRRRAGPRDPQTAQAFAGDEEEQQEARPRAVPLSDALKEQAHVMVLGEPGAGKSTALQFIGLSFAADGKLPGVSLDLEEERIPVLISLKAHVETLKEAGLEEALTTAVRKLGHMTEAEAAAGIRLWRDAGRLAVLLDGLDEVAGHDRGEVARAIRTFARSEEGRRCRVVVASRTAGYRQELGPPFHDYLLKPFESADDAVPYVANWLAALQGWGDGRSHEAVEAGRELVSQMAGQRGLRRVLDNPLLLRLAVEAYVDTGEVVNNRSGLYRQYTEEIARRRAEERGAQAPLLEQAIPALQYLAWAMHAENEHRLTRLDQLLAEGGIRQPAAMLAMLREKMGLLVFSGSAINREVYFSHTTFQEYFVALHLKLWWRDDEGAAWAFLQPRLHHPAWREPIFLLAGALDEQAVTALVPRVLDAGSAYERELHRDLGLAAAIVGDGAAPERQVVEEIARRGRQLTSPRRRRLRRLTRFGTYLTGWAPSLALLPSWGALLSGLLWSALWLATTGDFLADSQKEVWDLWQWLGEEDVRRARWLFSLWRKLRRPLWLGTFLAGWLPIVLFIPLPGVFLAGFYWSVLSLTVWSRFRHRLRALLLWPARMVGGVGTSEYVRATYLLGWLRDEEAVPGLLDTLGHEDGKVRRAAADALGKFGEAAVPHLLPILRYSSGEKMFAAADALGEVGKDALPGLLVMLQDRNRDVRWSAALALGNMTGEPARRWLQEASQSEGSLSQLRREIETAVLRKSRQRMSRSSRGSLRRLRRLGVHERREMRRERLPALPELLEALRDEDHEVRATAVRNLGGIRATDAAPELIGALQDEDSEVRETAAWALGESGDAKAIPALIEALHDESEGVRRSAARALGWMGRWVGQAEAIPALTGALQDESVEVRQSAALALADIGEAEAIPDLIKVLQEDDEEEVRETVARVLGRIGGAGATPALMEVLEHEDENEDVRESVALALGRIGNPDAVPALIDVLRDDEATRWAAAEALGRIGDVRAVPILIEALSDYDEEVRRTSAEALGRIGDAKAVPALIDLIEAPHDKYSLVPVSATSKPVRALEEIVRNADPSSTEAIVRTIWWHLANENDYVFSLFARIVARLTFFQVDALASDSPFQP